MPSQTLFITFPRDWSLEDLKQEIKNRTGIDEFLKIKPLTTPAVYLTCKSTADCEKILDSLHGLLMDGYSMKVKFADDEIRRPQTSPGIKIKPLNNVRLKNLSEKTTEEDLRRLFGGLGCSEIVSMTIFDFEENGSKQTRASVCFSEFKDLKKIREKPLYLHGNKLYIEPSPPKSTQKEESETTENMVVFSEASFPKLTSETDRASETQDTSIQEVRIQENTNQNQDTYQTNDQDTYTLDLEFRVESLECRIGNLECTIDYLYRYIEMLNHPGNPNISKAFYEQYTSEQVSCVASK